MTDTLIVEYVDPSTVLLGKNIRTDPELTEEFLDSVKTLGVHTPCPAVRTADGEIKLMFGSRRRAAAIANDIKLPVFVIGDEDTSKQGQVDRLFAQWDENEQRAPLTAQDKAAFVQTMLDLKISQTQIKKRAGLDKAAVDQARKVAASKRVMTAAPLEDLEMAATIAEFDTQGDTEAVDQLNLAIQGGSGQFRHAAQNARDSQAERFQKRDVLAELAAAGITVLIEDESGDPVTADGTKINWQQLLAYWKTADGERLTEESHAPCPGHAAFVRRTSDWEDGHYVYRWEPAYYCTDPQGNGHQERSSSPSGKKEDTPEAKEEAARQRRIVIDNNKQWRAARTVRQTWLKELLTRKNVPADALPVILGALTGAWWTRWDRSLSEAISNGHSLAGELLGLTGKGTDSAGELITAALRTASPDRQQVIALGMVLAAWETTLIDDTWRRFVEGLPQSKYHRNTTSVEGEYLLLLESWGYSLSDIEKLPAASSRAAATRKTGEEDSTGED